MTETIAHYPQDVASDNREASIAAYVLQTTDVFNKDFPREVSHATGQVALHAMQHEVTPVTDPVFDVLKSADDNPAIESTRFRYDRVAHQSISIGDSKAWSMFGITKYKGDKSALKHGIRERKQLIAEFEERGISDPSFKKRGEQKFLSHDHIKLAIAGDVAWILTMNLRASDFEMSNFAMKIREQKAVSVIKEVFADIENGRLKQDRVVTIDEQDGKPQTEILVDAGNKGDSVIYDRAIEMVDSLQPGDEFVLISQWPPNIVLSGRPLLKRISNKAKEGVRGLFLTSPAEDIHPLSKGAGRWLMKRADKKYGAPDGMDVKSLSRKTHVKAFLIKRANGEKEVLFGSHNMTNRTVKNGTRELAMWTKDLEIVDQVFDYIEGLEDE